MPVTPVLLTQRLRLDGHRADDLDALAGLWQQPEVYAGIGDGRPRAREDVWLRLLRHVGQWTLIGHGMWVVRRREGGAAIGEVGFLDVRRAIEPPLDVPEAAWMIGRDAHGQGLAGEAVAAVLDWADARGMAATCCIIDPGNAPSIRLAERNGYRADGQRDYAGKSVSLFRRRGGAAAA